MYLSLRSLWVDCTGSVCEMSISSIHIAVMSSMVDEMCLCELYELAVVIEANGGAVEEDEEGKRAPGALICPS